MAKIENRGGARIGSGRKPLDPKEKKVSVNVFVKAKHLAKYKTKAALKIKIESKIENGTL